MGADTEHVSAELFDKQIADFSIDSRSVDVGELFFALSQEDYARAGFNGTFADGHRVYSRRTRSRRNCRRCSHGARTRRWDPLGTEGIDCCWLTMPLSRCKSWPAACMKLGGKRL